MNRMQSDSHQLAREISDLLKQLTAREEPPSPRDLQELEELYRRFRSAISEDSYGLL